MTILTVRNLKPEVHQRLREQAAANGRSMEAEARAILEAGVSGGGDDMIAALRRFAQDVRPTDEELATIFPPRNQELQRPIVLGDQSS